MSATVAVPERLAPARGVSLGKVLAAELTKLRTLRSTYWTLFGSALATVGLGAAIVMGHLHDYGRISPENRPSIDPVAESMIGLWFGLLGFAVFGVLAATSEYSTGTIRTTVAAVPRRGPIVVAKAVVASLVTGGVATVTSFASFFAVRPILAGESLAVSLGEAGVVRAVLGGAVLITGAAVIGLGLGLTFRHTAGAIAAVTLLFFVAPILVELAPESWSAVTRFLPQTAGSSMYTLRPDSELLSPGAAFVVFVGWTVAVLGVAAVLFQRRDV